MQAARLCDDDATLAHVGDQVILGRDVRLFLDDGRWLSDNVLDTFMQVLQRQGRGGGARVNVGAVSSNLSASAHAALLPASRLIDRAIDASTQHLLMPLHVDASHWVLVHASLSTRRVHVYDAMDQSATRLHEHCGVQRLLEVLRHGKSLRDPWCSSAWRLAEHKPALPVQQHGHNCGVFVCAIADCISRGVAIDFPNDTAQLLLMRKRVFLACLP